MSAVQVGDEVEVVRCGGGDGAHDHARGVVTEVRPTAIRVNVTSGGGGVCLATEVRKITPTPEPETVPVTESRTPIDSARLPAQLVLQPRAGDKFALWAGGASSCDAFLTREQVRAAIDGWTALLAATPIEPEYPEGALARDANHEYRVWAGDHWTFLGDYLREPSTASVVADVARPLRVVGHMHPREAAS